MPALSWSTPSITWKPALRSVDAMRCASLAGLGKATAWTYLLLPMTSATRLASGVAAWAPSAAMTNRINPLRKTAIRFHGPALHPIRGALLMSAHAKFHQRHKSLLPKWLLGVCDLDHSFGSQRARKKFCL